MGSDDSGFAALFVSEIQLAGTITTVASGLNGPVSVAVDPDSNIYVSERTGERILKIDASGAMITLAGNGMLGFSEDGTPTAKSASPIF